MKILIKARWLSLDITAGALVLLFFISDLFAISPDAHVYLALAIAIWSIYTLDHLNDARKLTFPGSPRHRFHKRYFKEILFAQVAVLIPGIINLYFLEPSLLYPGLIVAFFSAVYLVLQQVIVKSGIKELTIALGYTVGIFLYPISELGFISELIYAGSLLFLIAYTNIVLISFFDREVDQKDGTTSLALLLDPKTARFFLFSLIILSLSCALWILYYAIVDSQFVFFTLIAESIFLFIISFPGRFARNDRFRLISDLVFFIPIIIMMFA